MDPLETLIAKLDPPGLFDADCAAVFGDQQGQRLLFTIVTWLCPVFSTPAYDPHLKRPRTVDEVHQAIGRNELAMALWRRAQHKPMPPNT